MLIAGIEDILYYSKKLNPHISFNNLRNKRNEG